MTPARLLCAVLAALVLLGAGCGGGDDEGGGSGGGGSSEGGNGGNGGGNGGEEDSEFALDTELDLGQPFAEEPAFDGPLGPVDVGVRTDRGGGANAQVPITFTVRNPGQETLEDVVMTIRFQVLPGADPEDPPVPGPGDPPLDLAPQTTAGSCAAEDTSSSATRIACELGTLEGGADATIATTSPTWFRLAIGMELTARGP